MGSDLQEATDRCQVGALAHLDDAAGALGGALRSAEPAVLAAVGRLGVAELVVGAGPGGCRCAVEGDGLGHDVAVEIGHLVGARVAGS